MAIDSNAPCPCDSGKKLKHCCLDQHMAWHRAGKGVLAYYVKRKDGTLCPVSEWTKQITARTDLVAELNPVTSSWVRNTLPSVACFGHPRYREQLLDHLVAMADGTVPRRITEDVADEFMSARKYLTFRLARAAALSAYPALSADRA